MTQSLCSLEGHLYEQITDADTRKLSSTDGGTDIYRTIFCTKCGNTKEIYISHWPPRGTSKTKVEERKEF